MTIKKEPTLEELFEALKHHIKDDEEEEEDKDIQTEANPYHSKEDGTFTTRKDADVYSLTRNATSDPMRGKIGKGGRISAKMGQNFGKSQCGRLTIDGTKKKKDRRCYDYPKTYGSKKKKVKEGDEKSKSYMKIRISKMNENDALLSQPSQSKQAGKDLSKAEPFEVSLDDLITALENLFRDEPHNKGIVFKKMKTLGFYHSSDLKNYCRSKGLMSQTDFIKLQNAQMRSQKGELYKPKGK